MKYMLTILARRLLAKAYIKYLINKKFLKKQFTLDLKFDIITS